MSKASSLSLIDTVAGLSPAMQQEVMNFIENLRQREQTKEFTSADLNLPDYNQPLDIPTYQVAERDLEKISHLWADEPDADALCKLLTA